MILAILQARISSSRLPGKVLKPILGTPMLSRQIERVKRAERIDKIIVATSNDVSDDPIQSLCESNNIAFSRGSLEDVLDRFYQCAKIYVPSHVVRLTGDCPLIDPYLIDNIIIKHLEDNNDYTSNTLEPTYPDGLDVEVFRFSCLERAWSEAQLTSEREHVTPYINKQPNFYKLGCYKQQTDMSGLRWTVDEQADFDFVSKVYEKIYPSNPLFSTQDILELLASNPELTTINNSYQRNEGYLKSLSKDELIS